jgi:adenylate cyclase
MAKRQSRKLAVILHADVVGSTTLVQLSETLAHERIQNAFHHLSSAISAYGGIAHEIRGDALVAEFARASDAVCAALRFQQSNTETNTHWDDGVMPVIRVGIALGEEVIADGTVTGSGVVLAQRVEQLAKPGGVCVTGAIHEALPQRLPFEQLSLGDHELKGFVEPVRVYQVTLRPGELLPEVEAGTQSRPSPRTRRFVVVLAAVAVVATGAAITLIKSWVEEEKPASISSTKSALPDKPSIAVLPFVNLSGDQKQEYLSDGITNDIITDLSKFRSLFVIASNSVFVYKGKPVKVQDLSKELGVRYVLEGSVQRSKEKMRVNAQLIDAATGHHLWAKRYDRDLKDLFALQDEIVQSIVTALAVKMDEVELKRVMRKATDNLEAYDYAMRGWDYLVRTTRSTNMEARQMFQRAIEADPRYASAYVGLGWTYRKAVGHGWTEFSGQALQQAHDLAQKALSLEESASAYRLLGFVYLARGQYDLATHTLEQAIELNPNDWESLSILGSVMLYTGRPDEAIQTFVTTLRFDPAMEVDRFFELGLAYYLKSQYAESIKTLEQGVGRNPKHPFLHIALAAAYAQADRLEDAARATAAVRRLYPFFEVDSFGTRFSNPADRASIAKGLRKAGLE